MRTAGGRDRLRGPDNGVFRTLRSAIRTPTTFRQWCEFSGMHRLDVAWVPVPDTP